MKLFRSAASPHQTALAMIGAKAGSAVIIIGAREPSLSAEVALVTGLNGRTLVVVPEPAAKTAIETAAANAGALIDIEVVPATALPFGEGAFDVAVLVAVSEAAASDRIVREAARVIRPGGRVVIIEGKRTGSLNKLLGRGASGSAAGNDEMIAILVKAGLRGARLLGAAEGVSYFEAVRPAGSGTS